MSPVPVPTTLDDTRGRLLKVVSSGEHTAEAFLLTVGLLFLFYLWMCCAKVSETAFVCWKIAFGRCASPYDSGEVVRGSIPCGPDVTMDDFAEACPPCNACFGTRCVDKSTTQERFDRLEAWKNKGLITQAAYDRRRAELVALL